MVSYFSNEESPDRSSISFRSQIERFFFYPTTAHSLALVRILTGAMIAYIHFVWMLNLEAFMGPNALIDNSVWRSLHSGRNLDMKWTYLAQTESMTFIWIHELAAFAAGLFLAIGFKTRYVCIAAWFLTLMTTHRMTGFLFGLDQIAVMLVTYLCLANSGGVWSLDAWLHRKQSDDPVFCRASWANTFSTRLIQLHLCVIYFFGGIGKMRGETWWDGSAIWYSAASYEYQSLDLTWIGYSPFLASIITHVTVFWELSYCFLIWPARTRPWMLATALLVHAGIALFLGMITFGFMMMVANLAFVAPAWLARFDESSFLIQERSGT
jgi:uncharacterized membrane protein YphA (DoxX/SURF4 family)